jgi:radical SAM protein with 4Fe4S-binding SPASM domain
MNLLHDRDYRIIPIDDLRALLFVTGNHRLFEVNADLGERLTQSTEMLTSQELDEWKLLAEAGYLTNVHTALLSRSRYSDGANLAININLTGLCNLACTYCFADGGDYGRIKDKMESGSVGFIFDFIREHVTRSRVVRFEFFGGEPLLNFARIQQVCEQAQHFSRQTGVSFVYRISTNLTVLPAEAIELFASRDFIVSVSIDGGRRTHDENRPTRGGQGSHSGILENCVRLRAASERITLVARMTVVGESPSLLENVRELWALDLFDYFQIYPGVTPAAGGSFASSCGGSSSTGQGRHASTINSSFPSQLTELLDVYPGLFQPGKRFKGVLEYERHAQMVLTGMMAIAFCSAGETYFTFSPDNSIMPCHRLVGRQEFQAGTARNGLAADLSEWTLPVDRHPVCSQCWARYLCGGGCRQENFIATGTLRGLNEEMCRYQQRLAEGILRTVSVAGQSYRETPRHLDDLFVSCGRPVVANGREAHEKPLPEGLHHFRAVGADR